MPFGINDSIRAEVADLRDSRGADKSRRPTLITVAFSCSRYDLEADKLYSITWYKDHEEFYRYVPRGEPMKHSYRVEGVKVDVS